MVIHNGFRTAFAFTALRSWLSASAMPRRIQSPTTPSSPPMTNGTRQPHELSWSSSSTKVRYAPSSEARRMAVPVEM